MRPMLNAFSLSFYKNREGIDCDDDLHQATTLPGAGNAAGVLSLSSTTSGGWTESVLHSTTRRDQIHSDGCTQLLFGPGALSLGIESEESFRSLITSLSKSDMNSLS